MSSGEMRPMESDKTDLRLTMSIDSMDRATLQKYLAPHALHRCNRSDKWEDTDEGIDAAHALVRLYGLCYANEHVPDDWAYQLFGDIGLDYSAITIDLVIQALRNRSWLRVIKKQQQAQMSLPGID